MESQRVTKKGVCLCVCVLINMLDWRSVLDQTLYSSMVAEGTHKKLQVPSMPNQTHTGGAAGWIPQIPRVIESQKVAKKVVRVCVYVHARQHPLHTHTMERFV